MTIEDHQPSTRHYDGIEAMKCKKKMLFERRKKKRQQIECKKKVHTPHRTTHISWHQKQHNNDDNTLITLVASNGKEKQM